MYLQRAGIQGQPSPKPNNKTYVHASAVSWTGKCRSVSLMFRFAVAVCVVKGNGFDQTLKSTTLFEGLSSVVAHVCS